MTPGALVCAYVRASAQYHEPRAILDTGYWRVTAVKHDRCYVSHVSGARHADGICGWSNQWFLLGDERVVLVEQG